MKKRFCIFVVFLLVLTFSSCKDNNLVEEQSKSADEIVVGFSMATLLEDRWIQDRDFFMSKAQEQDINVIVKNANKDSDLQYKQVCEMLDQGIDVLMIVPNDSEKEAKCVKEAKSRGVPVISYDRLVFDSDVDIFLSFDNEQVGVLMAEYLTDKVPDGGYLMVCGSPNDSNANVIRQSFIDTFNRIKSDDAVLLDETWAEGWVREEAFEFVAQSVKTYGSGIKAIMCGNDSLAWGTIDALSEAGIAGGVAVVGMDADLAACQRIVEGKQGMTVYKPISALVDAAVQICIQLANSEAVPTARTIDNNYKKVPYLPIEVIDVTINNIDEVIINGGFHLKEEVYNDIND